MAAAQAQGPLRRRDRGIGRRGAGSQPLRRFRVFAGRPARRCGAAALAGCTPGPDRTGGSAARQIEAYAGRDGCRAALRSGVAVRAQTGWLSRDRHCAGSEDNADIPAWDRPDTVLPGSRGGTGDASGGPDGARRRSHRSGEQRAPLVQRHPEPCAGQITPTDRRGSAHPPRGVHVFRSSALRRYQPAVRAIHRAAPLSDTVFAASRAHPAHTHIGRCRVSLQSRARERLRGNRRQAARQSLRARPPLAPLAEDQIDPHGRVRHRRLYARQRRPRPVRGTLVGLLGRPRPALRRTCGIGPD